MISKSIIEKLREIYQSLPKVELIDKGDGWVNQYDLLRAVGKVGINYKNLLKIHRNARTPDSYN